MNLRKFLDQQIESHLHQVTDADSPAVVKPATKPEFGQYQANGVMGAAKKMGANPRELAQSVVVAAAGTMNSIADLDIAGPGFINISLKPDFVSSELMKIATDPRLGVPEVTPGKYLVDYSSPNLAKEMHIGHLRSTAIGDAAVRILEFIGHQVIRANHVGDWGAQFGSLLAYMDQLDSAGEPLTTELKDLEAFYQKASALFKSDESFAERSREFVVRLQSGDEKCLALWQRFITESINHCQAIYELLDITLTPSDIRAESAYNNDLANVISDLEQQGLVEISDGARCIFLEEYVGKDGKLIPAIIQKSDGGYPYMATDLAAARYRSQELRVNEALYFVDGRQSLHLSQVYHIARKAGYIRQDQNFQHIPFGTILNKEGKPFKTRQGGVAKLADVAQESITRARALVEEKNPDIDNAGRDQIARVVGIGAIKYAELSKNRTTDYIFDWDTMLSFDGNTAPYLQYAYTRIISIFRRADEQPTLADVSFVLKEPAEFRLGVKLLQYPETVENVLDDYQANILCNYLYELSQQFMSFYESCPVLKADSDIRTSRLGLCAMSANTLKHGLSLLGINTVDQM